ncbi:MAG TPA: response regulator [Tepidisphaeraceae bacterium]|nr:response regulator [Tepidisphaeraceae bacterium]
MKIEPTVLIADDETNIRLMLRTTLESVGYAIVEATNGREALEIIDKRHPNVMILDLSMPQLDGMSVLSELKNVRADKKPRTIILTAYGSIPAAVKAIRLGAIDFLEKPISPDEVRESVEAALIEPLELPAASLHDDPLSGGYAGVLERVRKSLRLAKYTDAETLLMKAADLAHKDAAYFNLLGVLYESQRQWRLARKFYGKSLSSDKRYEPAVRNMRRLQELVQFGRSREPVTLGDESDIDMARLP